MEKPEEILRLWFGDDPNNFLENAPLWWKKDASFDAELRKSFEEDITHAVKGDYDSWRADPPACLALIILLDQFSRNIFRDTPQAFAQDELAQKISRDEINKGTDQKLHPVQRVFFYMPLMHSEDINTQELSLKVFKKLADEAPEEFKKTLEGNYDFALRHAKIIQRFGRYPHRNAILGRKSTPEEEAFLKEPGSSF